MLPSTEQIMIIDSIIADKNNFLNKIPLTKESGSVNSYKQLLESNPTKRNRTHI